MARGAACAVGLVACLAAWAPAAGRGAGKAQASQERTVGGPVTVAHGRRPLTRGRWRVQALVQRSVAPVPGQPGRAEDAPCLRLVRQGASETRCVAPEPELWRPVDAVALNPNVELQRVARGYLLWGFGGRRTTHLTAVLGGGHRVRLRVRRFPASLHSVAGWLAWVVPRHEAVRRVVGPGGRRLSQFPQSLAPATVALDGGLSLQGRLVPPGPAGLAAGPLPGDPDARLLIRHSGARICPEIDRPDPWEPSCDLPPVAPADATLLGRGTRRGDTFGGVVPASVTAVELRDAGHRVRVAAIPAGPAAGQWAGLVHVFLAQLPSLAVAQIRLLDSGGQTLGEQTVLPTYRTTTATQSRYRSRLTSRVPGGGRFVVGVDTEGDCLALLPRAHGRVAESGYSCETSAPELLVPCRPRLAAVVAGAKGRRRLWVGTSRGARISGRLVRVGHKHVWLAVAPVSAELRAVGWRDRRGRARRRSLGRVPAADRQCGYRAG